MNSCKTAIDDVGNLGVIELGAKLAQSPFRLIAKRCRRRARNGVQRFFGPLQAESQGTRKFGIENQKLHYIGR